MTGDDAWPPLSASHLEGGGAHNQLVRAVFEQAGYDVVVKLRPWARAMAVTRSAHMDVITSIYYTEKRAEDFLYSNSYDEVRDVLVARADFPLDRFGGFDDLQGYRIGVVRENALAGGILDQKLNFWIGSSSVNNLRHLIKGQLDLVADMEHRVLYLVRNQGIDRDSIKFLEPALGGNPVHIGVSRKNPRAEQIIADFNKSLKEMRDSGALAQFLWKNPGS